MEESPNDNILQTFFTSAFSVDCVVFGFDEDGLKVLCIQRGTDPYKGMWALPGDLVYPNEGLDDAVIRVLQELTGLTNVYMEQTQTFGKVDRHPLGRVLTVGYYSLIRINESNIGTKGKNENLSGSVSALEATWINIKEIPDLAFDHSKILQISLEKLKEKVRSKPVGFELLPKKFTLTQLQVLYESILGKQFDIRNFRKRILSTKLLVDLKESQSDVAHRPAKLYQFNRTKYQKLEEQGVTIEL